MFSKSNNNKVTHNINNSSTNIVWFDGEVCIIASLYLIFYFCILE